ncbi:MAG: FHA domain-containing protein [Candidatus Sericytochromatia bacterium]|nr:FHA domain-containing protein [Candidatus Sericytochromatia bacterium]
MTYICVKGHASDDSDYCSVCGFKMEGTQSSIKSVDFGASSAIDSVVQLNIGKKQENCPSCGIPHKNGLKFCEMCGYNFEDKTPLAQTVVNPALDKLIALTADAPVLQVTASPVVNAMNNNIHPDFKVVITADSSLYTEDADNPFPQNTSERIFHLDLEENLVGRTNRTKNINPEIPLNDAGVSHRHMKFIKSLGGIWQALELGSSNGTKVNGVELEAGVPVDIKSGDSFTLGMWTRITVKNR